MPLFTGVVPPVVTPLNADFTVDFPSFTRTLENLIEGGVHGLFVLGSTSEVVFHDEAGRKAIIEHAVKVAGHDHVGIGGDLDGIPYGVEGLGGVEGYPLLFAELIRRGWSDRNLAKLAGGNILRVMRRAEEVASSMKDEAPSMATLETAEPE